MSGNVQVEKANDLAASAGCQNAVIGFIPLKPPFAGLDDLDSSPAMRADSGSWFERLVKPFVTALKTRRRTFLGSVFVGKEKRRKEQVSSSQIFDSLFCICSEQ